jgi:hypothetical protein
MRRRRLVLLVAAIAAGAVTLGATAASAGASVGARSHHSVVAKKKTKCNQAAIKTAWDYFLDGAKGYTPQQQEAYIQGMDKNAAFKAQFEASAAKNADAAKSTTVVVNSIKCAKNGKSAVVNYDLVLNGTPAKGLAPAGTAVLEKGKWKVAATTVCDLQALGDPTVSTSGPCADIISGTTSK